MLPDLLRDVSFFQVLFRIDQDLAETCRQAGCPYCQGPLYYSPYLRKPRGGPKDLPEEYQKRFSLCCGREECRRRVLPPSCLFLGRKVYWQAVILVALTLRQSRTTGVSINRLMRMFSIARTTIVRWIQYFRSAFPVSTLWQRIRGRVHAAIGDQGLPGLLVDSFLDHCADIFTGLVACLQFLAAGQAR
jgi:hypothetical protein